jgi:hypothetical protein
MWVSGWRIEEEMVSALEIYPFASLATPQVLVLDEVKTKKPQRKAYERWFIRNGTRAHVIAVLIREVVGCCHVNRMCFRDLEQRLEGHRSSVV